MNNQRTDGRGQMAEGGTPGAVAHEVLKAPFPWFGGKSRAADLIWPRLGTVPNYVEPFAGSLAVLLRKPSAPGNEIVNDIDCYVANAWRAMRFAPQEVAGFCDWPVNEADLHARHRWLHGRAEFRQRMEHDPDFFDARIAGYWIWGLSCWIGDNFCRPKAQHSIPKLQDGGVNSKSVRGKLPHLTGGQGVARQVPHLTGGQGVARQVPHLTGGKGQRDVVSSCSRKKPNPDGGRLSGVHKITGRDGISRKAPRLRGGGGVQIESGADKAIHQTQNLVDWFERLANRLRFTKVCCGDWARVLTKASTYGQGLTGVLLDPPYDAEGHDDVYGEFSRGVSGKVREWAIENGSNPLLRIAFCGYEGEHVMPADWSCIEWKAAGGYASAAGNTENSSRERIWFSPHCLNPEPELFKL